MISPTDQAVAVAPRYSFRGHPLTVRRGHPVPLGASRAPNGVNFVIISRHATSVRLVISEPCNPDVFVEIPLGPNFYRTGDHWHIRIDGLPDEFSYGYRVDGPRGDGHRFDPSIVLIDPASRALACGKPWGQSGGIPRRSLLSRAFNDRSDDINPRIPREDTILYELHVRGFTVDESSGGPIAGSSRRSRTSKTSASPPSSSCRSTSSTRTTVRSSTL
jgi:glycogen operon protein